MKKNEYENGILKAENALFDIMMNIFDAAKDNEDQDMKNAAKFLKEAYQKIGFAKLHIHNANFND